MYTIHTHHNISPVLMRINRVILRLRSSFIHFLSILLLWAWESSANIRNDREVLLLQIKRITKTSAKASTEFVRFSRFRWCCCCCCYFSFFVKTSQCLQSEWICEFWNLSVRVCDSCWIWNKNVHILFFSPSIERIVSDLEMPCKLKQVTNSRA